jgi:1-acyl-sn-glycerol-3-phosphate acyltransferase
MINFLKRIFSIWGGIVFFGVYLLLFPIYFLLLVWFQKPPKPVFKIVFFFHNIWAFLLITLIGCYVRPIRYGKLKKGQTYIFISNHRSYLDIPLITLGTPRALKFLGKAELVKMPLFGFMYKRMNILVDRSSKTDRARSLNETSDNLKNGIDLCIYPEGTSKTPYNDRLGNLKDGAFILAIQNQVPIVPVTIINSNKALTNDGKFLMRPFVKFTVITDEPIPTQDLTEADLPQLKAQAEAVINKRLKEYYA